jgi:predicted acylesterase/phospholipase RssA
MTDAGPLAASPLLGLLPLRLQEELVEAAGSTRVPAQEWLFHEGEPGDRLYVVRSGRLRVVAEHDGRGRILRLLGSGAVLGELAVLTGAPRSAGVQAVRDAELLEIDGERFQELLYRSPELGVGLATALAAQIQRGGSVEPAEAPTAVVTFAAAPDVPVDKAWRALVEGFEALGDVVSLEEPQAEDAEAWDWGRRVGELERRHDYVLLRAELDESEWSRFCLRQADRVLLATNAGAPPASPLPDGCDVVFLEAPTASEVAAWSARAGFRAHHIVPWESDLPQAARRIARRLTGQSLGLVLSGGGARAFSHVGVLQALETEGLVVDRFGGTSMGAFVGAMAALGWTPETMVDVCRSEFAHRAPFSDYTFPRHALIRARRAASMLRRTFGELALEQLTRPLFTVSADLLSSRMVVHRTGSIVEAVGASMAIPGLSPPVSRQSQLLVDGGVLNNLPTDVMTAEEPGPVVAVDVMRRLEASADETGRAPVMPTILETLARATVLGSVERAETNRPLAHLLIAPEVQDVSLRGFRNLDRIVEAGRLAAETALAEGGRDALEQARRRGGPRPAAIAQSLAAPATQASR